MKIIDKSKALVYCLIIIVVITNCEYKVTEFEGFDGIVTGKVIDESGNIVPGDIKTTTLMVRTLGEGDKTPIDIRVKGDGTFQNTKLFRKKYRAWILGPVIPHDDTLYFDLTAKIEFVHDFIVVPFITLDKPVIANPTSTTVNVSYNMKPNSGKTISKRELYCSTIPFPTATTGSGPFYHTVMAVLDSDSGNITLEGLTPGTDYFLRLGAQAVSATGLNFSEQITFSTP